MKYNGTMQTIYEAAGGRDGLLRLASAWHTRVLEDEMVSHAFSHGYHPQHSERLAAYWAEALGGPTTYSDQYGDETSVVRIHSGNGPHEEMDRRAIACFDQALEDVGLAATSGLIECCTITSRGPPRPRCLITTTRQSMCRTVCTSRSGPGRDSSVERRLATFESGAVRRTGAHRAERRTASGVRAAPTGNRTRPAIGPAAGRAPATPPSPRRAGSSAGTVAVAGRGGTDAGRAAWLGTISDGDAAPPTHAQARRPPLRNESSCVEQC